MISCSQVSTVPIYVKKKEKLHHRYVQSFLHVTKSRPCPMSDTQSDDVREQLTFKTIFCRRCLTVIGFVKNVSLLLQEKRPTGWRFLTTNLTDNWAIHVCASVVEYRCQGVLAVVVIGCLMEATRGTSLKMKYFHDRYFIVSLCLLFFIYFKASMCFRIFGSQAFIRYLPVLNRVLLSIQIFDVIETYILMKLA